MKATLILRTRRFRACRVSSRVWSPLGRGSYRKLEELIKKAEELERKCNPALKDGKKGLDEDLTDFQRMKKKIAKDVAEVRQVPRFLPSSCPPCARAAAPRNANAPPTPHPTATSKPPWHPCPPCPHTACSPT